MDADGSHQTRLTRMRDVGYDLAWFPDGHKLAVWRTTSRNIYTVDLDGSKTTPLTSSDLDVMSFLTPSPDGRKLAFLFYNGYQSTELHVVYADKGNIGKEKVLAKGLSISGPPSWSPDGRKISYRTHAGNTGSDIMAVGLTKGSKPEKLFTREDYTSTSAWRPRLEGGKKMNEYWKKKTSYPQPGRQDTGQGARRP